MAIYAPKIFSNDPTSLQKQVLDLVGPHMGLEVALYGYAPFGVEESLRILALKTEVKILHLWQQKISLSGMLHQDKDCLQSLSYEMAQAKRLGISKAVIHHGYAHNALAETYQQNPEHYADSVLPLLRHARQHGLILHPENTFEGVDFHRRFFKRLLDLGANHDVGFCLDLGHTKVFSSNSLDEWLSLIKELHASEINVHYHVHVNRGDIDDHLTLCEGHIEGLLSPSPPWLNEHLLDWLQRAIDATPNAIFCQEHPASKSFEAIWFFQELLNSGRLRFPLINP
jgi:Xylose isomerase-like TIM barrel